MRDIRSIKHDNLNQYYQMLDNYSSWSRDALKTEINRLRRELRTASFDQYTKEKFLLMIEAAEEILYNKKENVDKNVVEIKKDVKIGNVILEKGDKIKVLNEVKRRRPSSPVTKKIMKELIQSTFPNMDPRDIDISLEEHSSGWVLELTLTEWGDTFTYEYESKQLWAPRWSDDGKLIDSTEDPAEIVKVIKDFLEREGRV
jgi:hypothetical protein